MSRPLDRDTIDSCDVVRRSPRERCSMAESNCKDETENAVCTPMSVTWS